MYSITKLAIVALTGYPMAQPNVCWYCSCSQVKKLFFRTNSSNLMMFVTEISVRSVRVTSCCNFSRTICKARSTGMDVNDATTSNDTIISSSVISWSLTCWANTTLLVTEYFSSSSGDEIETKCSTRDVGFLRLSVILVPRQVVVVWCSRWPQVCCSSRCLQQRHALSL